LGPIIELRQFFLLFFSSFPSCFALIALFLTPRHMKALLQKDHALFGQDKAFFDVDKSAIVMPTEDEVRALIAPKQSTSAA
jgi:hypothetical protein